jgi:protein phosphatase
MTEIITGFHYDIGGREVYEDRVDVQEFTTPGNLNLRVAVVADGVGGENKGERASQTAIDTLFRYMRSSADADVPTLLTRAVTAANQSVHRIVQETGGASTTMSVAAILNDETLYIANVGDSRVYLCRDQELVLLSIDHTYANVMPWRGQISREEARANPRAEALMRAIGPRPKIPIDIGFYVNTTDPRVAHDRGKRGLPVREGDSILVSSDGLTKISRRTGQPFTTDEEILRVLTTQEGDKAARSLVSFALGRDADDNVSAAVIQMPDPTRRSRARRPFYMVGGAVAALIVIVAVVVALVLQGQNREQAALESTATADAESADSAATRAALAIAESAGEASELAQAATGTAEAAATMTAIVAAFTPTPTPTDTPTPTPRPTRIPNQIGILLRGSESKAFTLADTIDTADSAAELHVNHDETVIDEDAHFFAQPNTRIEFETVTADPGAAVGISLLLYEGGDLFIDSGGYDNGIDVSPIGDTRISFVVSGSCMSLQYDRDATTIAVGCYAGTCGYRAQERDELTPLTRGNLVLFDLRERQEVETRRILLSEGNYYKQILLGSSAGLQVYNRCILPLFPPTRTPTPRPTFTSTPVCLTPLPTGCQSTLADPPSPGSIGITAAWLGLGMVIGLVLAFDWPVWLKRPK